MTRDELNREMQTRRGSWPAVVFVYALILGTMVLTGMVITGQEKWPPQTARMLTR